MGWDGVGGGGCKRILLAEAKMLVTLYLLGGEFRVLGYGTDYL